MKYKIDKSDLFIDNKLYPEGSEIDLTEEKSKGLEDYLIPLNNNSEPTEGSPELVSGSIGGQKKLNTKGNKK